LDQLFNRADGFKNPEAPMLKKRAILDCQTLCSVDLEAASQNQSKSEPTWLFGGLASCGTPGRTDERAMTLGIEERSDGKSDHPFRSLEFAGELFGATLTFR